MEDITEGGNQPNKNAPVFELNDQFGACFAVAPKRDCPHIKEKNHKNLSEFLNQSLSLFENNPDTKNVFSLYPCPTCDISKGGNNQATAENWLCLECSQVSCSRYVEGHAADHADSKKHSLAFSFSDASFWCYECDSYITNKKLDRLRKVYGHIKHRKTPQGPPLGDDDELDALIQRYKVVNTKFAQDGFPYEELISGLKNKTFKKIAFVTGAGISVSAGIPDFRSKGGLYEELGKKYGKSEPEQLMTLEFFLEHPECLYGIMKEFLKSNIKPTIAHKFFAKIAEMGMMSKYFTQNIDGLEQEAGLEGENLIQAHGHCRSAKCANIECKKPYTIEALQGAILEDKILKCEDCGSPVKPDVILFGESLPFNLMAEADHIKNADLVFVMGTSLKVFPFNLLVRVINKETPVVLVNFDNVISTKYPQLQKLLFLEGDIDTHISKVCKDAGISLE